MLPVSISGEPALQLHGVELVRAVLADRLPEAAGAPAWTS